VFILSNASKLTMKLFHKHFENALYALLRLFVSATVASFGGSC
jgi:hypothetical protein